MSYYFVRTLILEIKMCRLLGMVANQSVDLEFSLGRFKDFARDNRDGWGVGWYENNTPRIFKQGISALNRESELLRVSQSVRSRIFIAHVREGTGAMPAERNSHPFAYKNWLFAHNGSVDRAFLLPRLREEYRRAIQGETDSEVYFYWLLQNIIGCGNVLFGIEQAMKGVMPRPHTGLNFLLSDGRRLYAFRYAKRLKDYYSLYRLERKLAESLPKESLSSKTNLLLRTTSIDQEKAVLVCSEKLTSEHWQEIENGHILMIRPDLEIKELLL